MTTGPGVGSFYHVIKTIKGHRYLYKQRTFRVGGKVCTESHYLGPAGASDFARVTREITTRKAVGPSHAQVRSLFRRLTDVDGAAEDWIKPWSTKAVNTTFEPWVEFDEGLKNLGAILTIDPDRNVAAYNPYENYLIMPPGSHFLHREGYTATQAYYYALSHELAHWSGHWSRLDRKLVTNPRNEGELNLYAREEMIAEATALLVLAQSGRLPPDISNHVKYFQKWHSATLDKAQSLDYAMDEAQRAASFILSAVNTTNR